jgi:hypothetical protein
MTQLSESKRRSLAAIGDICVIPAQAGIQIGRLTHSGKRKLGPGSVTKMSRGDEALSRLVVNCRSR